MKVERLIAAMGFALLPGGCGVLHRGFLSPVGHELDNLYVTDASFFPSIGAANPTLTISANALRVASIIEERLG